MLATIFIVLFCGAIGAYIRHEARESSRPWLATAALAAVFLALTLLKPPGQELFGILWAVTGGLAAGSLLYGIIAPKRR